MPIKKLCSHPSCLRIRLEGSLYCEKHQQDQIELNRKKQEYLNRRRESQSNPDHVKYWQTSKWKQLSSRLLREHPYCEICRRTDLRLNVHHNYPKHYNYFNDEDFYDESHLMVVCVKCHERLTHC